MAKHIAGEVQVTTQLLDNERRDGQLRFDGDPVFAPTPFEGVFQQVFVKEVQEFLKQPVSLWFGDGPPPRHEVQQLFTPTQRCDGYLSLGDDSLWCHLDHDHQGPHYDAYSRVEWSQR